MTYTTLTYNGVEKTLADWGISQWSRTVQNQAKDEFACAIQTPMDGVELFPYGANVVVQINRAASTVNPVNATLPVSVQQVPGVTFSGGTRWFCGYCTENDRDGGADGESFNYRFEGPYQFFFERLVMQKLLLTWNSVAGRQIADYQSDIILGLSLTTMTGPNDTVPASTATNLMSIAQQVKEICLFAQAASKAAYGSNQFQCDALTNAVNSIGYDLLDTPSANVLIEDFFGTPPGSNQSTQTVFPNSANPAAYQLRCPLDAVNAITCAEAMRRQLQWLGGIGSPVVWTDHTQTPPQLRIATRAKIVSADTGATTTAQRLTGGFALNLPLAGVTVKNKIKKRADLIPAAVHFKYKVSGTYLSQPYSVVINDVAAEVGGILVEGIGEWGSLYDINHPGTLLSSANQAALMAAALLPAAVVQTFDLQGTQTNGQQCTITTTPINLSNPTGGGASTAFWKSIFPHLAQVTNLAFYDSVHCPVTVTDPATGAAIDPTTYIYRMPDGQAAPWMNSSAGPPAVAGLTKKARISAYFTYTEQLPGALTLAGGIVGHKQEFADVTLTTLPSGTYSSISSVMTGEPIPYGLAGYVFALESIPQYEGSILVQETEISDLCPIGNTLNITGGLAEWSSMNACVQSVRYLDNGQTEIIFGPARHLGPAQFIARQRTNIGPRWYWLINVNPQNTSSAASGALGTNVAMQAPSPGAKQYTFQSWFTNLASDQTGSAPAVPPGIHIDAGTGSSPLGLPQGQQVVAAAGPALTNGYARLFCDSTGPGLKVFDNASINTLLNAVGLTITNGSLSSNLSDEELYIQSGTDAIQALITDITGLGTAKFQSLTFCMGGTYYTAKFLMTNPVATSAPS